MKVGLARVSLTPALSLEDPVPAGQARAPSSYTWERKFDISDRVEGRWRPGSGRTRRLADSITVTALYGHDGKEPFALIAMDAGSLRYALLEALKQAVVRASAIPARRLVFLPSHSHADPRLDPAEWARLTALAVTEARDRAVPVQAACLNLGLDGGKFIINRRVRVPGLGARTIMFNDGCAVSENGLDATEQVRRWVRNLGANPDRVLEKDARFPASGPVDSLLQAVFFRNPGSGAVLGGFVRFAAHPAIVSAKLTKGDVSADYVGHLRRRLEENLGGVFLFGLGPCGDLRPLSRAYTHEFAGEYGSRIADTLLAHAAGLDWRPVTTAAFDAEPVRLPLSRGLFQDPARISIAMSSLEKLYDRTRDPAKRGRLQNDFWRLYRAPGFPAIVRPAWKEKGAAGIELKAVRLGQAVILCSPGELFTAVGARMIAPFSGRHPLLISLADEYISYIPTDEERPLGGYEPSVAIVAKGAPDSLARGAQALLKRIYQDPPEN